MMTLLAAHERATPGALSERERDTGGLSPDCTIVSNHHQHTDCQSPPGTPPPRAAPHLYTFCSGAPSHSHHHLSPSLSPPSQTATFNALLNPRSHDPSCSAPISGREQRRPRCHTRVRAPRSTFAFLAEGKMPPSPSAVCQVYRLLNASCNTSVSDLLSRQERSALGRGGDGPSATSFVLLACSACLDVRAARKNLHAQTAAFRCQSSLASQAHQHYRDIHTNTYQARPVRDPIEHACRR